MNEFSLFFKIIASFAYRRSLLITNYLKNTKKRRNWKNVVRHQKKIAKKLFSIFIYVEWIRFLRKLIEIHEGYNDSEKILLSLEAKAYIARTIIFLRRATNYKFEKICDDVSGKFKNRFDMGLENGVKVFPGKLEELFADEKWDLEQNVRWLLGNELKSFNSSLIKSEQLPESLADELFDELSEKPFGTALAAIKKMNTAYFDQDLWRDNDIWSGIRDLSVSIEAHGKEWLSGNKLNDVFAKLFSSSYDTLKKKTGIQKPADASNINEFLQKLKRLQKNHIPANKRCGRHILITHLTRNFSNHVKGLSGNALRKNLALLYSSQVRTLFTIYAKYKGV